MFKIKSIIIENKKLLFTLLSSFLIFLSYPKISLSPLAFLSLIPFIIALFEFKTKKEAIKYGFIYGFSTYLLLLYWIYPTLRAGEVNPVVSLLGLLFLSALLSIEFVVISFVGYMSKTCNINMTVFVLPSVWVLVDSIKTSLTKYAPYFPWFQLGYSQWNSPYILNLSHLGQTYTLTFLIVSINVLLASIIIEKEKTKKIKKFIAAVLVLFISLTLGKMKYDDIEKLLKSSDKKIKIAVIQPSIDFYMKWDWSYVDDIKSKIETVLKKATENDKPDIIIWPENALYGWIDDNDVFNWLCKNIKQTNTYHIVGSVSRINRKHVSAYLINPKCEIIAEYDKRILVPFGEYVPFRSVIGKFAKVVTALGEFEEGNINQKPFVLNELKLGQTICYETIFDYLFYQEEDVDLFINITNDGWYLNTSAPYQHFAVSVSRAVSNSRPFIRAANNGISAFIYPNGKILSELKLNEYGYIKKEIKLIDIKRQNEIEKNIAIYISLMIITAFMLAMLFR
ncbi:MAG: apolipoprotein N-acyltransferase [Elusimicrobiales bacterium]